MVTYVPGFMVHPSAEKINTDQEEVRQLKVGGLSFCPVLYLQDFKLFQEISDYRNKRLNEKGNN